MIMRERTTKFSASLQHCAATAFCETTLIQNGIMSHIFNFKTHLCNYQYSENCIQYPSFQDAKKRRLLSSPQFHSCRVQSCKHPSPQSMTNFKGPVSFKPVQS